MDKTGFPLMMFSSLKQFSRRCIAKFASSPFILPNTMRCWQHVFFHHHLSLSPHQTLYLFSPTRLGIRHFSLRPSRLTRNDSCRYKIILRFSVRRMTHCTVIQLINGVCATSSLSSTHFFLSKTVLFLLV